MMEALQEAEKRQAEMPAMAPPPVEIPKEGESRKDVMTVEGDHQRKGDTKARLDEDETVVTGDGASQNEGDIDAKEKDGQIVDTEAGTERDGLEGLDGAPVPGSNVPNMPDESPVAGRTRGRIKPNSAREGKQLNSNTEVREKVGRETEVLTASAQPRKGRRPGRRRTKRLPHEDRWSLRVWI